MRDSRPGRPVKRSSATFNPRLSQPATFSTLDVPPSHYASRSFIGAYQSPECSERTTFRLLAQLAYLIGIHNISTEPSRAPLLPTRFRIVLLTRSANKIPLPRIPARIQTPPEGSGRGRIPPRNSADSYSAGFTPTTLCINFARKTICAKNKKSGPQRPLLKN